MGFGDIMIEILTSFTSKINLIEILYKLHKIVEFWEEKLIYTKNFINNLRNIIITKVITLYNLI